jgi:hypothetical protein
MKTFFRWGLIVLGVAVLIGIIYNYKFFFHIWPLYPFGGWRYYHFGPRVFPFFPFLTLAVMFAAGLLIFNFLFRSKRSTVSKEEGLFVHSAEVISGKLNQYQRYRLRPFDLQNPNRGGEDESLSKI